MQIYVATFFSNGQVIILVYVLKPIINAVLCQDHGTVGFNFRK